MSHDITPPPSKRSKTTSGASRPIATQPLPPKSQKEIQGLNEDIIRIFSWNVNGIQPFLQKSIKSFFQPPESRKRRASSVENCIPPASLRGFLHKHDWPAMLFLQEVKVASRDTETQNSIQTAINLELPSELTSDGRRPAYEAHFTLPKDPHNARGLRGNGKIYGVCSILHNDLQDRFDVNVRTVDWDREGRVSVVELKSSFARIAVFNIYAVNGTDNPHRDSTTGTVRGTRHDRKLEFHRLLMEECVELEQAGWDWLLVGDMNVAPDARDGHPNLRKFPRQHVLNRLDFHEKLLEGEKMKSAGLSGVDIWRKMHGEERSYTYYPHGKEWGTSCDRVDYFIAGSKLWEKGTIKGCGILNTKADRGPSDHVPIWADIELPVVSDTL